MHTTPNEMVVFMLIAMAIGFFAGDTLVLAQLRRHGIRWVFLIADPLLYVAVAFQLHALSPALGYVWLAAALAGFSVGLVRRLGRVRSASVSRRHRWMFGK